MAIYIDADKLKQDLADLYDFGKWDPRELHFSLFDMVGNIDVEPTADVAPVVHAHWRENEEFPVYNCSHCCDAVPWSWVDNYMINHCPFCGAKMDGEVDDE